MKIKYRPITNNDIPFLKRVYSSTREEEMNLTNWSKVEKLNFIEFQFNAQHSGYLSTFKNAEFNIIIANKTEVGRLYILRTKELIRIIDISILPQFKFQGIGTTIFNNLIHESEKSGIKLYLSVLANNPVLNWYKKLGFKKVDETGVYYFMERLPKRMP